MKYAKYLICTVMKFAILGSGLSWAEPPAASAPTVGGVAAVEPLSVVMALLLVVLLIVALGWLLRRSGLASLGSGGAGRVLASLPLGGRERAVLIEIGGEQLLLGVSTGQVNLLARFETPVLDVATAPGEFATRLKQWLEPGKRA